MVFQQLKDLERVDSDDGKDRKKDEMDDGAGQCKSARVQELSSDQNLTRDDDGLQTAGGGKSAFNFMH